MTTETESKHDEQYRLACEMAVRYDRVLGLCERIQNRNNYASPWNQWDDELVGRIIDEHIGDPLSIEWKGTTWENPAYCDGAAWQVDEVVVTLGTGGPASGINFRDGRAYPWHQDWFTSRVESASPLGDGVGTLAAHWGIEDY